MDVNLVCRLLRITETELRAIRDSGFEINVSCDNDTLYSVTDTHPRLDVRIVASTLRSYMTGTAHHKTIDVTQQVLQMICLLRKPNDAHSS